MMKLIILCSLMTLLPGKAMSCTPIAQKPHPPQWLNGEWVEAPEPDSKALNKADIERLLARDFDFIFSAKYQREVSFSDQHISHLNTQDVWQGKLPKTLEIERSELPGPHDCQTMQVGQQYLLFGNLGSRHNPVVLKEFRPLTRELHALLGQPNKRWVRGRLIILKE